MRLLVIWTAALGFSAVVSACTAPERLNPNFGDSVRHNMAVHIINPDGRPIDPDGPEMVGTRVTGVASRYNQGKVTEIERVQTSRASETMKK